jgi:hypothetical protein
VIWRRPGVHLLAGDGDGVSGAAHQLEASRSVSLHITVLLDERITDDELRANTMANGLRIPPLGGSCRFTTPRCGSVVGFGAIPTPDIPAAVDALVRALDAATGHQG